MWAYLRRCSGVWLLALCTLAFAAGCAVPTEPNIVIGKYVSRGHEPTIELLILPTHLFEEQVGSRRVVGRWEIVTSLSGSSPGSFRRWMSPESGMHLTGLIESPS